MINADFPFFGACFGIGTLGNHQGAVIDRRHAEPVGFGAGHPHPRAGSPLLRGLPATSDAFTGREEVISQLAHPAALLATSPTYPV
ncbi:MAG TPA: hypothetical protein VLW50_17905 [Streptosporangiaceae bacterium]|nr:hypothetical protein [Streptosporangiaceae bacterium]